MVTISSAKMALARFTSDSIASDSNPTESVMYQAQVLSVMVMMATATEARSRRCGVKNGSAEHGVRRSAERDPGKLALADLHHIGAGPQLQPLSLTTLESTRTPPPSIRRLPSPPDAARPANLSKAPIPSGAPAFDPGQGHLGNFIGHAALAAVDEILLGRIGRRAGVKARRDFLGQRHFGVFRVAARLPPRLSGRQCRPRS